MARSDYTEYSILNAVKIVRAYIKAGKPQMITAALLDHRSAPERASRPSWQRLQRGRRNPAAVAPASAPK